MEQSADIGLVGLGVMGANLALNFADTGLTVSAYDRSPSKTMDFMAGEAVNKDIISAVSLEELVDSLARPRTILIMIPAGNPVDTVIEDLVPLLEPGDIIMDGGNSQYDDTDRRAKSLSDLGLHFLGVGFSGGEEGARNGPSIMPGGDRAAWDHVEPMLKGIAAVADDGTVCCEWVGPGGAGHFVKMVHNGIEYGDMQVIAEAYDLMRRGLNMSPHDIGEVFRKWDEGRLQSYLVEITADILEWKEDGEPMIDKVLDAAGQKGTGKWMVVASTDLAEPTTLAAEAVYARFVSSEKELRGEIAEAFARPPREIDSSIEDIEASLYASKIICYAQGFHLIDRASTEFGWDLNLATIASLWKAGCIIRAEFLKHIAAAYEGDTNPDDLTLDPFFAEALQSASGPWRSVVGEAALSGIPVPAYSSALSYFDGMRSTVLPANLIQAQRDYFGAHTFERTDKPRGEFFHHEW